MESKTRLSNSNKCHHLFVGGVKGKVNVLISQLRIAKIVELDGMEILIKKKHFTTISYTSEAKYKFIKNFSTYRLKSDFRMEHENCIVIKIAAQL